MNHSGWSHRCSSWGVQRVKITKQSPAVSSDSICLCFTPHWIEQWNLQLKWFPFLFFFKLKTYLFWKLSLERRKKKTKHTTQVQLEFTYPPKNRICSPESLLKGHLDICKGNHLELWMSLLAFSKSVISQVWGVAVGAVQSTEQRQPLSQGLQQRLQRTDENQAKR